MDTLQSDRPLSEVDEIAERVQASTVEQAERWGWDRQDARLIAGVVAATVSLIILALLIGRRAPRRTAQDRLLERTEAAFDRARESLETIAARLASLDG